MHFAKLGTADRAGQTSSGAREIFFRAALQSPYYLIEKTPLTFNDLYWVQNTMAPPQVQKFVFSNF